MSGKPLLLDTYCGAGGSAVGYARAGFEVVGVDIAAQPHFPFEFHQADALEFIEKHGRDFDVIHASPPCQAYTPLRALHPSNHYPDLVAPTRAALLATGRPWAIENVPGAPLRWFVTLCGTMFGLRVYRHRRFECSHLLMQPHHPRHTVTADGCTGRDRKARYLAGAFVTVCGHVGSYAGDAMGIDWMTGKELSQAIPPAYCEWLGRQLRRATGRRPAETGGER